MGGDREHATQGRGRDLISLSAAEFPKEFDLAAGGTWPMIAAALVSRMVGTLEFKPKQNDDPTTGPAASLMRDSLNRYSKGSERTVDA